jgi:hypothetical protein
MLHDNQEARPPAEPPRDPELFEEPASGAGAPAWDPLAAGPVEPPPAWPGSPERLEQGRLGSALVIWLVVLVAFGVGGVILKMNELALLMAVTGLFVAAQAADADSSLDPLYYSIAWVAPAAGAAGAVTIAVQLHLNGSLSSTLRTALQATAAVGGVVSLLSIYRGFSNALVAILFRSAPSHTLRLAARITVITLLLMIPAWFVIQVALSDFLDNPKPIFERVSLGGELVGYIALALAGVGFMLRRRWRESLERLGIRRLRGDHLLLIVVGVIALYALNAGADWVQRAFFPALWQQDHQVNQKLAAGLGVGRTLLLGLSAGIGEEITMRGALQPKLGVWLTSLLFAALHVQYSWFGMLVIFLLGVTLGTIRARASTTTAMVVHTIYDVIAVFSV